MQKAKNPPKRVFLIGCTQQDYSAGLALRAVAKATLSSFVLPACRRTLYESRRCNMFGIWCTQEDSNFRPLGS